MGGAAALAGAGLVAVLVNGEQLWVPAREAREGEAPLKSLDAQQAQTMEAFAEVLLPGAAAAGVAHFVDQHLALSPAQTLLMIRYLDVPPPFLPFYAAGLAALDRLADRRHGVSFARLDPAAAEALVGEIIATDPEGWDGPPAPFFSFIVRADAVDVVYGTREGFERLGIPVMAHLEPPSEW
jgi:hypothetical protein